MLVTLERRRENTWRAVDTTDPNADTVQIDACPVCNGAFFDRGELDVLAGDDRAIEDVLDASTREGSRRCPRGHGRMLEHMLTGWIDTPLDRCSQCGGLWLDGQERRKLAHASTQEGQESTAERWAKHGAVLAAQLLVQLPVEVENPHRKTPWTIYALLVALLVVFFAEIYGVVDVFVAGVVADRLAGEHDLHTLVTHLFVHASWMHLLGNGYFLYVFGDNVEYLFKPSRFLTFFLFAGVAGALVHVGLTSSLGLPLVGASGAIAGVMAAYLLIFPHNKLFVPVLFVPVKLPVWAFLFVWVVFQAVMAFAAREREVAWLDHVGGFAFGLAVTPWLLNLRRKDLARVHRRSKL